MVVVALYALLSQLLKYEYLLSQRSEEFALKARAHRKKLSEYQGELWVHRYNSSHGHKEHGPQCRAFWEDPIAALERCEKYEELMYRKYCRAASSPWRTITSDPAPPPVPPSVQFVRLRVAVVHEPADAVRPE
jgi:hypothetical protein